MVLRMVRCCYAFDGCLDSLFSTLPKNHLKCHPLKNTHKTRSGVTLTPTFSLVTMGPFGKAFSQTGMSVDVRST